MERLEAQAKAAEQEAQKERIAREKIERERADKEAAEKAAQEKAEKERLKAEEAEKSRPDREKLIAFAAEIEALSQKGVEIQNAVGQQILSNVRASLHSLSISIATKINEM